MRKGSIKPQTAARILAAGRARKNRKYQVVRAKSGGEPIRTTPTQHDTARTFEQAIELKDRFEGYNPGTMYVIIEL